MWRNSATITAVNALDAEIKIYSNGPDALRFLTKKEATMIPYRIFPWTLEMNRDYETQLQAMCREIELGEAIAVYFYNTSRLFLLSQEDFESKCDGVVIKRFEDGVVYSSS